MKFFTMWIIRFVIVQICDSAVKPHLYQLQLSSCSDYDETKIINLKMEQNKIGFHK